ncbi:MAG: nucleotidyl transferase AbiEii/AbiGii toxin family protein [Candidatus Omnitrophica bacterium]|nr:nucleotidyl transferase AbiEii/AbiGii toxin family protein [Candidatus Omnitrophota bacterium]
MGKTLLERQADLLITILPHIDRDTDFALHGGTAINFFVRDMFDIMLLLQNEGITEDVRKAFIVYLISHNRTMAELLAPNLKDMRAVYDKELEGMSSLDVTYENIESAQRDLVKTINKDLTDNERMFLISFKKGNPKWELLGIDDVEKLPAVQWKLSNLKKMDQTKNKKAIDQLKRVMDKGGV